MKKIYTLLVIALSTITVFSQKQDYNSMINSGTYTVQEIQRAANAYFANRDKGKGTGYKHYKRWEYQALRSMNDNGVLKPSKYYYEELKHYNKSQNNKATQLKGIAADPGNWEQLGPYFMNTTSSFAPGTGRITSFAVDKSNTDHIIVGSETGGVWKTTNGGTSWVSLCDNEVNMTVYALAIDPNNSNIYYWGSKGGEINKSINGGATWSLLAFTGSGRVNKLLINPNNSLEIYCSVEGSGVYKSSDSGINWTDIGPNSPLLSNGYDVEFKPQNSMTVYASGNKFLRSTDGGATFTEPSTVFGTGAKMIAVSDNNPAVVYVIEATGLTTSSSYFNAIYKSTDSGATFVKIPQTKNFFSLELDGSGTGGQAAIHMDIAVSQDNVNEVFIGGGNTWRSIDGGTTFEIASHWEIENTGYPNYLGYTHADICKIEAVGSKIYVGSDGGLFKADDPSETISETFYTDLSEGLGIRQFYRFGISQTNPVIITGGSQDNGQVG